MAEIILGIVLAAVFVYELRQLSDHLDQQIREGKCV
jgi:hypothetical protein